MKEIFEMIHRQEILACFGFVCLLGTLVCGYLMRTQPEQILGVSAWLKPFKFFLSVMLFVWTMAFFLNYLEHPTQGLIYSISAVVFFSLELAIIVYQAVEGKLSHFNTASPLDQFLFNLMALAITVLMLHTVYVAFLFYQQSQCSASILPFSIAVAISITVIFALEGFFMVAMLQHTMGGSDGQSGLPVLNWSNRAGDLRVAHFFGIHALQLLPLLSFYLVQTKRDVLIIALLYGIGVTFTFIQALRAKPFISL
ncbi:hypothetical protein [Flavobacterium sp.]|uniref:hypothetical protein n=1 Tax=Flavobacterium sp. TaxID=239 RepID=UPI0033402B0A